MGKPKTTEQKVQAAIRRAICQALTDDGRRTVSNITLHTHGYKEPGYDETPEVIALGNWNDISCWNEAAQKYVSIDNSMPRLGARLHEKYGVACEWEDEWTECCSCGGLVRTEPNGWGWQKQWVELDDGPVCCCCIQEKKELAEEYFSILDGRMRCLTMELDPADYGYIKISDTLERGFHHGQDVDPEKIWKALRTCSRPQRFIFVQDFSGQFDMGFSVWVHEDEFKDGVTAEEFKAWFAKQNWNGPSIADAMARGLQTGAAEAAKLPDGDGIKVIKVHADGTATAKLVSAEDFVAGKALE